MSNNPKKKASSSGSTPSTGYGVDNARVQSNDSRRAFLQKSLGFLSTMFIPGITFGGDDAYDDITVPSPVKSVIFFNMEGGMSHVDTLDHKANLSPFSAAQSSVNGINFAESMQKTARELHRIALVRSTWSEDGDHNFAQRLLHTGYRLPQAQAFPDIPSLGAVIAFAKKSKATGSYFPAHVTMGRRAGLAGRGGFLGVKYSAFQVGNLDNPVNHLKPAVGRLSEDRLGRRGKILDLLNDGFQKDFSSKEIDLWKQMFGAAREFAHSEQLDAFDLNKEKPELRARFGQSWIGKACLMARRLAQAEVPFIEIGVGGWDTHKDNQSKVAQICKDMDPAIAALLGELGSSGLLKQTLVVFTSEFGRTPDVGGRDGRDHWPRVWSTLIGGGNIPGGIVVGESDAKGQKPTKRPVHVRELVATIYKAAGVDPEAHPANSMGRPFPLVPRGTNVVSELIS